VPLAKLSSQAIEAEVKEEKMNLNVFEYFWMIMILKDYI
jgi:hypothetical protein